MKTATSNGPGLILSSLGPELLADVLRDLLDLLECSCAVFENNGECALNLFSPGWCQFVAQEKSCTCCREFNRGEASLRAMETGSPVDIECGAGARVLAVPIRAGVETVGSITVAYGDPPQDPAGLERIAGRHRIDYEELLAKAAACANRPPYLVPLAHKRLISIAQLIGEIVNRKRAEDALWRLELFHSGIFEQSSSAMWISDHQGTMVRQNQACRDLLHITDEEVVGKYNVLGDSVVEDQGMMPKVRRVYEHGETVRFELHYDSSRLRGLELKRSASVILDVSMFPIRGPHGQVTNVLIQHRDITEQRALELRFAQSQKLESLGRLAGGVAHDFNNLLTVINGYSDLLLEHTFDGDPLRSTIEQIRKAGEQGASLTQQLLAFSRKQAARPRPLNVNSLVEENHSMFARLLGENVNLSCALAPGLGQVMIDPGQMHQVLMNLLVNARDAMPGGGKVIIETANEDLDASCPESHPELTPGPFVLLAVSDEGVGMDEDIQRHLFEPFFTTKPQGSGTGLGLSLVYGIVRQNGGWIWVFSEPGKGTTMKVYLPRIDAPVPARERALPAAAKRVSGTILLVEDQAQVRNLVMKVLQSRGYRVFHAATGAEAVDISRHHPGAIDLLLTDVVMPGMTGKELADALRSQRPELRVLFMSGHSESIIMHHGTLAEGAVFLSKPFTPDQLALRVQEVLSDLPAES